MKLIQAIRFTIIIVVLIITSSFRGESYYTIQVKITNIRNSKGRIQLQIYKDQESFKKEEPAFTKLVTKEGNMSGTTMHYDFKLPAGTYGVALLDDENRNTKMDYGVVMPKEGFGFSDYYHTSWSRPTFSDFSFVLKGDKSIVMKIRYV
ncbi:MAG: DUF2141 domain-containing protein [Bacteroidota bacterium]